ncbi:unnamed protein product, partial [Brenthis ino]
MSVMDSFEDAKTRLGGWEEIYTDFDGYICKFNRCFYRRSTQNVEEFQRTLVPSVKTENHMPLEKLNIEGIVFSESTPKSNILNFLNIRKDGDVFINYDYTIKKLVEKQIVYKYTRSKLLFCFY